VTIGQGFIDTWHGIEEMLATPVVENVDIKQVGFLVLLAILFGGFWFAVIREVKGAAEEV
jgi:hypothetical protein